MSIEEAERELGPRGRLHVTGDNRTTVRKWLSANGINSAFAAGLSYTELGIAYNSDEGLAKVRAKFDRAYKEAPEDFQEPAESIAAPISAQAIAPPIQAPNGGDKAAALHALIAGIAGESVSPAQVEAIIEDKLHPLSMKVAEIVRNMVTTDVLALVEESLTDKIKKASFQAPRIEILAQGEIRAIEGLAHHSLPELIKALSAGLHVYLPGPAGSGKTTAAEQAAKALGRRFFIQGAISGSHELLGYKDAAGVYHTTPFREAFQNGGIICLDEIDGSDAGAMLTMNAALANGCMAFPDQADPVPRHAEFQVIACANTYGTGADRLYVGRNQLDAATLDRFYCLDWAYDEALELALAGDMSAYNARKPAEFKPENISAADWTRRVQKLRSAASREKARVVISPRASIYGAKALAAGIPQKQVEQALIFKGMESELRNRIERGA